MNAPRTRRDFLADVGRGMLVATVGLETSTGLGLSSAWAGEADELSFGSLESLVRLMQETPAAQLLPLLTDRLRSGTELRQLVAAGALANARTFGGEDYVGFHTMMALGPAYYMAQELPSAAQPLPVFKVLYRNTNRLQEQGGRKKETLHPVHAKIRADNSLRLTGEQLREAIRRKDVVAAEETFARLAAAGPLEDSFNHLLLAVQDATDHRPRTSAYAASAVCPILRQSRVLGFSRCLERAAAPLATVVRRASTSCSKARASGGGGCVGRRIQRNTL
jgi:hypothetical protein